MAGGDLFARSSKALPSFWWEGGERLPPVIQQGLFIPGLAMFALEPLQPLTHASKARRENTERLRAVAPHRTAAQRSASCSAHGCRPVPQRCPLGAECRQPRYPPPRPALARGLPPLPGKCISLSVPSSSNRLSENACIKQADASANNPVGKNQEQGGKGTGAPFPSPRSPKGDAPPARSGPSASPRAYEAGCGASGLRGIPARVSQDAGTRRCRARGEDERCAERCFQPQSKACVAVGRSRRGMATKAARSRAR